MSCRQEDLFMPSLDHLITLFDNSLRTIFATPSTTRSNPGKEKEEGMLSDAEKRNSVGLMRVNHVGEVCAQALYQGQALTARNPEARVALEGAAQEEGDHLAWCDSRINELGGRKSLLNPVWYLASFALGAAAGTLGDKWNLGFLAETENQVEAHLDEHLTQLPERDEKSRAIVRQMKEDEARHAQTAIRHGGAPLPMPVKMAMQLASRVMKKTAYYL
jgi:3-demethoxyubiquinol 3-hydroxylase